MPRDDRRGVIDDRVRLQHMIDAARDVGQLISRRAQQELVGDMGLRRALINAVQEIGEAASRVSDAGRLRVPALPWEAIVGMRHRLVHGYFDINLVTLWKVAADEVPDLLRILDGAVADWPLPIH